MTSTTSNPPTDVRDMAFVHRTMRDAFEESARLVRANPAPTTARAAFLADHVDFALAMLHAHHTGEDELLYPLLVERVPQMAPMLDAFGGQHQELGTVMDDVSAASAAWRAAPSAGTAEALASSLDRLNEVLQPHLLGEEVQVVPLAAKALSQQEWDALGEHGVAAMRPEMLPIAFGMLTESLSTEDADYMRSFLPPPVREQYSALIDQPWQAYADRLRNDG